MTDTVTEVAPAAAEPTPSVPEAPIEPKSGGTISEIRLAAQRLAQRRTELKAERAAAEAAPPPEESAPEAEAAPTPVEETVESPSGEVEVELDPVETPSIEPPRSWTSEDKETFKALPQETQRRLVDLDRARELEVRKIQNDIAEQRKGFESERTAMAQARQQYEGALPVLMQMLQSTPEFADIKTMDDVTALAENDWPRYVKWDAHQKKLAAVQQELVSIQQRQAEEWNQEWGTFASEQDQRFSERYPESEKFRQPAIDYLKAAGFTEREIAENWNTKAWRDYRMQSVILDAVQWRQAKAKAAEAKKAPLPPVQKPGVSQARANPNAAEIQALLNKGSLTLREAARLNMLRSQARAG